MCNCDELLYLSIVAITHETINQINAMRLCLFHACLTHLFLIIFDVKYIYLKGLKYFIH